MNLYRNELGIVSKQSPLLSIKVYKTLLYVSLFSCNIPFSVLQVIRVRGAAVTCSIPSVGVPVLHLPYLSK